MTQQDDITSRLAVIEAIVTRLEYRLLGNGQPGELERLDTRISKLEGLDARMNSLDGLDGRIDKLEELVTTGRGAIWILGILLSLLTSGGLVHIFKVWPR